MSADVHGSKRVPFWPVILVYTYLGVLGWLSYDAISVLGQSPNRTDELESMGIALVLVPAVVLFWSVLRRRHALAWSIYWTWAYLFLGLAPAYQIGTGGFPWHFQPQQDDLFTAEWIILGAHATVLVVALLRGRFGRRRPADGASNVAAPQAASRYRKLASAVSGLLVVYIGVVAVFTVLMGGAMFSGRLDFKDQLAANAGVIGFGSLYFWSTAGGVVVPALAITIRKQGVRVSKALIVAGVLAACLAMNPLIGSRFLTGSLLVALAGAVLGPRALRWLPVGMILVFVTVFPTLDVLRGDGTGSKQIEALSPSVSMIKFDFDAFEMLIRAVSLHGEISPDLPSKTDLLIAPFLRWVPGLSKTVEGHASGPVVATMTGMTYTNVSMPLWGESYLIGGAVVVVAAFALLALLITRTGVSAHVAGFGALVQAPVAALLFIVLRGSLYEVLGYLLFAVALAWWLSRRARWDERRHAVYAKSAPVVEAGAQEVRQA